MTRADELKRYTTGPTTCSGNGVPYYATWYDPKGHNCEYSQASQIIRDLEATIAIRDARIMELEAKVRLEVRSGEYQSRIFKATLEELAVQIKHNEAVRAEVPEWWREIVQTLVEQRDDGHAEATDLLAGVSDDQLVAFGIEVP